MALRVLASDNSSMINRARDDWSRAIGRPIITVSSLAFAPNIRAIGASREDIQRLSGRTGTYWVGFTTLPIRDLEATTTIQSIHRRIYRYPGSLGMYIVDIPSHDQNRIFEMVLHELGHTLGFHGHSLNDNDIMWHREHAHTTLSTN